MSNLTSLYRTVSKGEEINTNLLRKIMSSAGLLDDKNEPIQLFQFSHGYSNLTYLIKVGEKEYVLRRPPFGAVKRGHDMKREYKVLNALNDHFSKAPKVYFFDDNQILGAQFYIMEKVNGIVLNYQEALKRNISADQFSSIANLWLDAFIELHAIDYNKIGLADFGKPDGYVSRQISNWSKQYIQAKTKDVSAADKVMKWMEVNQLQSSKHCLIHNDFKYDNVILKDDSWNEITAILDWEMATLGDPLMDLGTSIAYWTMQSDGDFIKKGIPSPTFLPGNPGREAIVEAYEKKSGTPVDNIVFYYVFGLFKIAVIAQQIYFRYSKGLTSDPRFAELDIASELLCKMALQSIQKNRIENLF